MISVKHSLVNAFKNLASVTFETEYTFEQAEKLKNAAKSGPVAAAAPSGGSAAPAKPVEEKVEEVIKPFGGDDDEY